VIKLEQTKSVEAQKLDEMFRAKVDKINHEFEEQMSSDMAMKEAFLAKSELEYAALQRQFEEEERKFNSEIEQLKCENGEKIRKQTRLSPLPRRVRGGPQRAAEAGDREREGAAQAERRPVAEGSQGQPQIAEGSHL